jgi:cytochrome c556
LPAKRLLLVLGAVCAVTAISVPAVADTGSIVQARADFFHGLGKSFKGLRDELKAPSPDLAKVRQYTGDLAARAPNLPAQFPAGSGPQPGVKTEAKAEIWTNASEFKQDAAALATAANALNTAAQGNDVAAIRTAADNLGKACKNCHMTFRQEDH